METPEGKKWDERIKGFYGDLIGLIGFIVTVTADQGADIAIRALPILAPLPNAISVFYVSGDVLGFKYFQSFAFSAAIELSMFGLFEVVLKLFDGLQVNPKLYKWPFWIATTISIGIMVLVMVVVAKLETKHPILAWLPLFSAGGATALILRRWHERNEKVRANQLEEALAAIQKLQWELAEANVSSQRLESLNQGFGKGLEIARFEVDRLVAQVESMGREIELLRSQKVSVPTGVFEPVSTAQTPASIRRFEVLKALTETVRKEDVNYSNLAKVHGVSDTTIRKDVEFLMKSNYWSNGSDWFPTKLGNGSIEKGSL